MSAGAAAAVTETIKIGTGVSLIAQHDPLVLAKTVATVDHLAEGRFLLGVGAGWNQDEMENHGVRYEERWKVCIEHLEAMKALWIQEEATYHGTYVNFDKVWSHPKPYQRPHPPIILGTLASKTPESDLKRYAEMGVFERLIPRCPTEDKDTVLRWLDRYAKIGASLA